MHTPSKVHNYSRLLSHNIPYRSSLAVCKSSVSIFRWLPPSWLSRSLRWRRVSKVSISARFPSNSPCRQPISARSWKGGRRDVLLILPTQHKPIKSPSPNCAMTKNYPCVQQSARERRKNRLMPNYAKKFKPKWFKWTPQRHVLVQKASHNLGHKRKN